MIASDVGGRGSDHIGGKTWSPERRPKAFRRRRSGVGLEGEQVGNGLNGGRKFKVWSVDDLRCERAAAGHVNGLGAVMRFLASGASGLAGLRAAQVFGTRQFVAGVIDDFVRLDLGRGIRTQAVNLARHDDGNEHQETLHQ